MVITYLSPSHRYLAPFKDLDRPTHLPSRRHPHYNIYFSTWQELKSMLL